MDEPQWNAMRLRNGGSYASGGRRGFREVGGTQNLHRRVS